MTFLTSDVSKARLKRCTSHHYACDCREYLFSETIDKKDKEIVSLVLSLDILSDLACEYTEERNELIKQLSQIREDARKLIRHSEVSKIDPEKPGLVYFDDKRMVLSFLNEILKNVK